MTTIKLCLGTAALVALHAAILLTPTLALAQEPAATLVMPELRVTPSVRCTERPLVQGSGDVRICEPVRGR